MFSVLKVLDGEEDATTFRAEALNGETVTVQTCQSRIYLHALGYVDTDSIFNTNAIKINGVEFRLSLLVCLKVDKENGNLPLFGQIREILMLKKNEVYFLTTLCKTDLFDTDFNAYRIDWEQETQFFVNCLTLAYYKPLSGQNQHLTTLISVSVTYYYGRNGVSSYYIIFIKNVRFVFILF